MDYEEQERINRIELAAGKTLLWLTEHDAPDDVIDELAAALAKEPHESSPNAWWLDNGDDLTPFVGDLDDGYLWNVNVCEGPFVTFQAAVERRAELLAEREGQ